MRAEEAARHKPAPSAKPGAGFCLGGNVLAQYLLRGSGVPAR